MQVDRLIFRKEYAEIDRWNESNGANDVSREIARGAAKRTLGWSAVTAVSIGAMFGSGYEGLTSTQRLVLFAAGIGGTMLGGMKASVNACMNVTATLAKDFDTTQSDFEASLNGFKITHKAEPINAQGEQA